METLECDQCSIVKINMMLQIALIDFINSVREYCSLKGIFVSENKTDANKSSFIVSVVQVGKDLDEILLESCKTIFKVLKELTDIDVSVKVLSESQLTGLQLDSLNEDENSIIYETIDSRETIQNECQNDINKGIQYVKKR